MKLLMIYCNEFSYNPVSKTLDEFPEVSEGDRFEKSLVAFIQTEAVDMENGKAVETKLVKNLKWAAKKNGTNRVVLHSFAHLSESKAEPRFTKDLFDAAQQRMINAGYECRQTPFGYFPDIDVKAPGVSQARIFKSF